jgi:hypothetical protein
MYLNVYVPQLQAVGGVVCYLRGHLGQRFASTMTLREQDACAPILPDQVRLSVICFKTGFSAGLLWARKGWP